MVRCQRFVCCNCSPWFSGELIPNATLFQTGWFNPLNYIVILEIIHSLWLVLFEASWGSRYVNFVGNELEDFSPHIAWMEMQLQIRTEHHTVDVENPGIEKTKPCPLVVRNPLYDLYMDPPKDLSLFSLGLPGEHVYGHDWRDLNLFFSTFFQLLENADLFCQNINEIHPYTCVCLSCCFSHFSPPFDDKKTYFSQELIAKLTLHTGFNVFFSFHPLSLEKWSNLTHVFLRLGVVNQQLLVVSMELSN